MRYTKCLKCGAPAQVIGGKVGRHVRPTDLKFCDGIGNLADAEPTPPATEPAPPTAPKKRPAKKTAPQKIAP
jgi:hypothetical protein